MSFRGVLVPVATPFTADLAPDKGKFIALCKAFLAQGAAGLAIFGTTSEANSISGDERMRLLEQLVASGVPAEKLMPGTGGCSITEAVVLTRHAVRQGCGGVLLLPPFFYKGVSDDGIFAFVERIIQDVSEDGLKIYLYHIPPMAQVGFSVELVGRLHGAYPDTVVGLKDSSGDWSNTEALIKAYPQMKIFPGSEIFLLDALRAGGAGCITATANLNARMISASYKCWQEPGADARQQTITKIRKAVQTIGPLVPVIKSYLALKTGDPGWSVVRPPLIAMPEDVVVELDKELTGLGYEFPGVT